MVAFYKVTCPVCQMAAPKISQLAEAYPGRVVAVGQDPLAELEVFSADYDLSVPSTPDLAPYPVSAAYGVGVVPTLFLVGEDDTVVDTVQSWDREGINRISAELAELTGAASAVISDPSDGLPLFRPG